MKIESNGAHKRIENLEAKIAKLERSDRSQKEMLRLAREKTDIAIEKLKRALPHVNFEDPE